MDRLNLLKSLIAFLLLSSFLYVVYFNVKFNSINQLKDSNIFLKIFTSLTLITLFSFFLFTLNQLIITRNKIDAKLTSTDLIQNKVNEKVTRIDQILNLMSKILVENTKKFTNLESNQNSIIKFLNQNLIQDLKEIIELRSSKKEINDSIVTINSEGKESESNVEKDKSKGGKLIYFLCGVIVVNIRLLSLIKSKLKDLLKLTTGLRPVEEPEEVQEEVMDSAPTNQDSSRRNLERLDSSEKEILKEEEKVVKESELQINPRDLEIRRNNERRALERIKKLRALMRTSMFEDDKGELKQKAEDLEKGIIQPKLKQKSSSGETEQSTLLLERSLTNASGEDSPRNEPGVSSTDLLPNRRSDLPDAQENLDPATDLIGEGFQMVDAASIDSEFNFEEISLKEVFHTRELLRKNAQDARPQPTGIEVSDYLDLDEDSASGRTDPLWVESEFEVVLQNRLSRLERFVTGLKFITNLTFITNLIDNTIRVIKLIGIMVVNFIGSRIIAILIKLINQSTKKITKEILLEYIITQINSNIKPKPSLETQTSSSSTSDTSKPSLGLFAQLRKKFKQIALTTIRDKLEPIVRDQVEGFLQKNIESYNDVDSKTHLKVNLIVTILFFITISTLYTLYIGIRSIVLLNGVIYRSFLTKRIKA